jgi:hypothetical protein
MATKDDTEAPTRKRNSSLSVRHVAVADTDSSSSSQDSGDEIDDEEYERREKLAEERMRAFSERLCQLAGINDSHEKGKC